MIPDIDYLMPKVQIGHSTVPIHAEAPRPNTQNNVSLNSPSPVSENLSSISGTTLARALIGSSFVLSSTERRGSRHRSGVARQDSATLPRGSFFLSDSVSSSPIPPVPPVPALLVSVPPEPNGPSTIKSGASTDSEYPFSDSYLTSPELAISSAVPRRISRIRELPSPTVPASTAAPLPTAPNMKPQRRACPVPARARVPKNGVFDVPKTAVEATLPINSQETTQHSSQEGSFLLSSDEHTLDEFDFLPPESLAVVTSPESDSSASYIASISPLPRRSDTTRGQRKRRVGGSILVRHGCMIVPFSRSRSESEDFFTAKHNAMTDGSSSSYQGYGMPSATISEHDYGELLNYNLTLSPESSMSSSSASAGYQTFPETPVGFSPLWSPGYPFLAKSDSQALRRRVSSLRSAGRGSGKLHSMRIARKQAVKRRSQSSLLPKEKTQSPKQAESSLPSVPATTIPEATNQSPTPDKVESQESVEPLSADRHPLAHISSSSSYLQEEEALRALARHSPLSLPSIMIDDPSSDPTTVTVSVTDPSLNLPISIPLPESPEVSPFNSPALADSSTAFSLSASPLQSSISTTSTAISQSLSSKSPFSHSSPSLEGSSFLPSPSPSTSLDEPLPRSHSPMAPVSSSSASDGLLSPSPSFIIPPPPYHTIVSERTSHHPGSTPSLSRTPSTERAFQRSRQPSSSSLTSVAARTRVRSRPPLPIGPRKPSVPGQVFGSLLPGIRGRNGSTSSVGSSDPTNGSALPWRKLHAAASQPPPKFQEPPPKWRGLTLEAAQWTFTSTQLQEIVSQAIQQSSEGSSLRFLRSEVLEGEIADEMHRLELQHLGVKAQYKELARKRWELMGALAGHVEGINSDIARTVEDLAEVLSTLDRLADKMHDTVLQMAQLKSLRDVHNTSALGLAVRKINGLFVRQMAEKERLAEQTETLRTERDEAWKHAEDIALDYDTLNDRVAEGVHGDASSATGSKRSTRLSAVRKSSVRQSQAGLRSRSRLRRGRSTSNATRPSSLVLDDIIPPVPRLPLNPPISSSALPLTTGPLLSPRFLVSTDPRPPYRHLVYVDVRQHHAHVGRTRPRRSPARSIRDARAERPPEPSVLPTTYPVRARHPTAPDAQQRTARVRVARRALGATQALPSRVWSCDPECDSRRRTCSLLTPFARVPRLISVFSVALSRTPTRDPPRLSFVWVHVLQTLSYTHLVIYWQLLLRTGTLHAAF